MRVAHALWLVGLSLAASGCALIEDGSHNFCVSVSSAVETHREKKRNREWAEIAWQTACLSTDSGSRTGDYAQGFKDGYAEFLFRGGEGEPPPVAPVHYRHLRYQNEKGYQAIEDWFAGYRHGAATARDTGARRWMTGPSALQSEAHAAVGVDPIVRTPSVRPHEPEQWAPAPPAQMLPKITIAPDSRPSPPPMTFETPRIETQPASPSIVIDQQAPLEPLRVRMDGVLPGPLSSPDPAPEPPARAKITSVNESPAPPPERARITIVNEAPAEPARARIKAITVAPEMEPCVPLAA